MRAYTTLLLTICFLCGFKEDGIDAIDTPAAEIDITQEEVSSKGKDYVIVRPKNLSKKLGVDASMGFGTLAFMGEINGRYKHTSHINFLAKMRHWTLSDSEIDVRGTGYGPGAEVHAIINKVFDPFAQTYVLSETFVQRESGVEYQKDSLLLVGVGLGLRWSFTKHFRIGFDRSLETALSSSIESSPIGGQRPVDKNRYISRLFFQAYF